MTNRNASVLQKDGPSTKPTLNLMTCGSVDDGKSTLIGRLLVDSDSVPEDQMETLKNESKEYRSPVAGADFSLLLDGLEAEREQGITIDVAYRYFSSSEKNFVIADAPGHEQYTKNMATAASTSDLAIILVDVRKGVLVQTRRHTRIVDMMGIKHVLLAVNKMDLVNFDQERYLDVEREYLSFSEELNFSSINVIPISAAKGDNVSSKSENMEWYSGVSILEYLDKCSIHYNGTGLKSRLSVQLVNRYEGGFRGYSGRINQGSFKIHDKVTVTPANIEATIKTIIVGFNLVDEAAAGESITVTLVEDVDISRGDVLSTSEDIPHVTDHFTANLIWLDPQHLSPGRQYNIKLGRQDASAQVSKIRHRIDVDTGSKLAASSLALNEIGQVNVSTSRPLVYEPYTSNRSLGSFVLIDKISNQTVGAGMISFGLRRSENITQQALSINKTSRAAIMQQRPLCIWLSGLSGAGKTTLANLVEKQLHAEGKYTYILDGDNIRSGLNRDLGFSDHDRVENIRRISEVAKLFVDAGFIVLVSSISPFLAERQMARQLFEKREFVEVFVDCPLEDCEERDAKGLYKKAKRGELNNFTGIHSAYERPSNPEIIINTKDHGPRECAELLISALKAGYEI